MVEPAGRFVDWILFAVTQRSRRIAQRLRNMVVSYNYVLSGGLS
jgi:hypothetical protein